MQLLPKCSCSKESWAGAGEGLLDQDLARATMLACLLGLTSLLCPASGCSWYSKVLCGGCCDKRPSQRALALPLPGATRTPGAAAVVAGNIDQAWELISSQRHPQSLQAL